MSYGKAVTNVLKFVVVMIVYLAGMLLISFVLALTVWYLWTLVPALGYVLGGILFFLAITTIYWLLENNYND